MTRRVIFASMLLVLASPVLGVLFCGWVLLGILYHGRTAAQELSSVARLLLMRSGHPKLKASIRVTSFVLALLFIGGLWLFSHLQPQRFGECHTVPLNLGSHPARRDCEAFGASDFVVPVALIVLIGLLAGDGDFRMTIPGLGTIERTRAGRKAARELQEERPELDRRLAEFAKTFDAPKRPSG
jgi:hypothetical protein